MKILLVEDHPIVRSGCQRLLHGRTGLEVIEASTAAEGLRLQAEHAPEVIMLDVNLPDSSGLEVLRVILQRDPRAKVLVFTMYEDPTFVANALSAGAAGYISKSDDPASLLDALDTISSGNVFLGRNVAQKLAVMKLRPGDQASRLLTAREDEVLTLLGQGKSLREVALATGLSYRTAAAISANIRAKLDLPTMAALFKFAVDRAAQQLSSEIGR
jgi:DNA-binding NarL/FixJ family response regulator